MFCIFICRKNNENNSDGKVCGLRQEEGYCSEIGGNWWFGGIFWSENYIILKFI